MPCYSYEEEDRVADEERERNQQERLDKATRAACEMSKYIESHHGLSEIGLSEETFKWIEEHIAEDEMRLEQETKVNLVKQKVLEQQYTMVLTQLREIEKNLDAIKNKDLH